MTRSTMTCMASIKMVRTGVLAATCNIRLVPTSAGACRFLWLALVRGTSRSSSCGLCAAGTFMCYKKNVSPQFFLIFSTRWGTAFAQVTQGRSIWPCNTARAVAASDLFPSVTRVCSCSPALLLLLWLVAPLPSPVRSSRPVSSVNPVRSLPASCAPIAPLSPFP